MSLSVIMDEDGIVTLPPDLVERLGWAPDTILSLTVTPTGDLSLKRADENHDDGEQ